MVSTVLPPKSSPSPRKSWLINFLGQSNGDAQSGSPMGSKPLSLEGAVTPSGTPLHPSRISTPSNSSFLSGQKSMSQISLRPLFVDTMVWADIVVEFSLIVQPFP